jgi:type II secretory ATPase GspE/PulE/Tfp pilus assembly ATPase PilB-like protein
MSNSKAVGLPLAAKEVSKTVIRPAQRSLTALGGKFEVTKELREMICLTEDGILYISDSHASDHFVLGFIERLRKEDEKFTMERVPLRQIQELYAQHVKVVEKSPGSTYTPNRDSVTQRQREIINYMKEATLCGASDIHFAKKRGAFDIKYRIHGQLELKHTLLPELGGELMSALYQSMCEATSDTTFKPDASQDARMRPEYVAKCGLFGARVATRPMLTGPLMVVRLLYDSGAKLNLDNMRYLPEQMALIRRLIQHTDGIVIVSGTTGSGKSTLLKVMLEELVRFFDNQIHLLTIEDPPEYTIEGANQTQLTRVADETLSQAWAKSISNAMRLDPDILMVGEMRDRSSAETSFQGALTGHGLYTTLHVKDAASSLQRLDDLGVDHALVSDPSLVKGLINQSLARTICSHCKIQYLGNTHRVTDDMRERIEKFCIPANVYLKGQGCKHCVSGVDGRLPIAEIILPNAEFMKIYRKEGKLAAREYWVKHMHGITKVQHLIIRINEGVVDPTLGERDVVSIDEDEVTLGENI